MNLGSLDKLARVGYEQAIKSSGHSIDDHPWDQQTEEVKASWREIVLTILEASYQIFKERISATS